MGNIMVLADRGRPGQIASLETLVLFMILPASPQDPYTQGFRASSISTVPEVRAAKKATKEDITANFGLSLHGRGSLLLSGLVSSEKTFLSSKTRLDALAGCQLSYDDLLLE